MTNLTYLKRLERRDKPNWGAYITISLLIFIGGLALYVWGYSNGLSEGMARTDATVSKALQGGYDVGVEKGLEALRYRRGGSHEKTRPK